ncbi:hypothetical protein PVAP13_3NG261200 [Panicum virgatum]|uniref:Uncharacterized protein n=1 Tax=Panicum virgatum TaxID=38727 RepID=A0A8T0UMX1_PANVG|nr:hypothetical protein PVAP13_3NG261200 [Panicum virgatum]
MFSETLIHVTGRNSHICGISFQCCCSGGIDGYFVPNRSWLARSCVYRDCSAVEILPRLI